MYFIFISFLSTLWGPNINDDCENPAARGKYHRYFNRKKVKNFWFSIKISILFFHQTPQSFGNPAFRCIKHCWMLHCWPQFMNITLIVFQTSFVLLYSKVSKRRKIMIYLVVISLDDKKSCRHRLFDWCVMCGPKLTPELKKLKRVDVWCHTKGFISL